MAVLDYMGLDGFVWFTGVVEDRNDPQQLGRVKVRCLGFHTDALDKIPTENLPWAHVMHPVTDPAMHGMGATPTFLVEGSWVVGFFRDAETNQLPIIMGTLPGIPRSPANFQKGFNDPRHKLSTQVDPAGKKRYAAEDADGKTSNPGYGPYPLGGFVNGVDDKDGLFSRSSGHTVGESDTNRLARNASHSMIKSKDDATTKDVPIANTSDPNTVSKQIEWDEPLTTDLTKNNNKRYNAAYPHNHVYETESGHIREYDDTVGSERISEYHKTGTFYEIDADGNKHTRIVGNNYEVIAGTNFINIKGDVNLTIDANCKTYIKGDWNIQVDGDLTEVVKGTMTQTVTGAVTETYSDIKNETVTGAVTETYNNAKTETVTGEVSETYKANQTTNITGTQKQYATAEIDEQAPIINLNKHL